MNIGCPKEIKNNEYRVGMTPASVQAYVGAGHRVLVERGAGLGSGLTDDLYAAAGGDLVETAAAVWRDGEMIVKVKEPLPEEYPYLRPEQVIYTYFHFAANEALTRVCLERKITAVAYETVREADGTLPLLQPMSEVAGRMAPLMGSFYLAKSLGGRGILLTGVPGVLPASVLVIGAGVVGRNAARIAGGLGARVTVLDIRHQVLEHLAEIMPPNVLPVYSDSYALERGLTEADLVIGAVLIPGAKAPKLIRREHLKRMKPGSVIVDVAIDQGGCAETSRPTTHSDPTYEVDGIIHYCVANMPGAYARTSTFAHNNCTIRYGLDLANRGVAGACLNNPALREGLNLIDGAITCRPVAEAFHLEHLYRPAEEALRA